MSAASKHDIRFLQLDAMAECLDMVATYAAHGIDHIRHDDEAGLQASLYRTVKSLNAALATWREMRPETLKANSPSADREVA